MNAISGGRIIHSPWCLGACALVLLLGNAPAAAGRYGGTIGSTHEAGMGIHLDVERQDLELDYDDGSGGDRLEVARIGIGWSESPIPGVRLGISLGAQAAEQDGRAAMAGLEPEGYFATFDAGARWSMSERFGVGLQGRLGYAEAEDEASPDGVDLDWWSATLEPALLTRLGERLELHTGARLQWLDGDERVTGANRASVGFREDGVAGAFVNLRIDTGAGGRVHLRADGGPVQALRLVFERRW